MRVVKYFFEEPASLEVLADDVSPDARAAASPMSLEDFLGQPERYRGYLAGSEIGDSVSTGATAVKDPLAFAIPMAKALGTDVAWTKDGTAPLAAALLMATAGDVLVCGAERPAAAVFTASNNAREDVRAITTALDSGGVVLRAEPAPDGVDWSLFSPRPLAEAVRSAFLESTEGGLRRWVIPLKKAHGEHRFYFERYDLSMYDEFECV